jgi:hypothetical protein
MPAPAAEFPTGTRRQQEDTHNLEARVVLGRARSEAMSAADRRGALRRVEAPAWVAEERVEAAAVRAAVVEVVGLTAVVHPAAVVVVTS